MYINEERLIQCVSVDTKTCICGACSNSLWNRMEDTFTSLLECLANCYRDGIFAAVLAVLMQIYSSYIL